MKHAAIFSLWVTLLHGCATVHKAPSSEEITHDGSSYSKQILLLADNQENTFEGLPNGAINGLTDELTGVAIRPPQQSLFGRKFFEAIASPAMNGNPNAPTPILHLGDFMDHSCEIEFARVRQSLDHLEKRPFAMAIGNHDGFAQGIFNPLSPTENEWYLGQRGWDYICRHAQNGVISSEGRVDLSSKEQPLPESNLISKDRVIYQYLNVLAVEYPSQLDLKFIKANEPFSIELGEHQFILEVHGKIIPRSTQCTQNKCNRYYDSYLVQVLDISQPGQHLGFKVILFDTNQPKGNISFLSAVFGQSLGDVGRVGPEQSTVIQQLAKKYAEKGNVVVFAGHHPWEALDHETRERLGAIFADTPNALLYLSAHTHNGFWNVHNLDRELQLLELNVSSLADWPIDLRHLRLKASKDRQQIEVTATPYAHIETETKNFAQLFEAWKSKTCFSPEVLKHYQKQDIEELIQRQMAISKERNDRRDIRGSILFTFFRIWFDEETDKRFLYRENVEQYRYALQSLESLAALVQKTLTDKPLIPTAPVEDQIKLLQNEFEREETNAKRIRALFEKISERMLTIQKAIDGITPSTHEPIVNLMACAHVSAAFADHGTQSLRKQKKPSNTFFIERGRITR